MRARPLGLLSGPEAAVAVASGLALPLAGSGTAFTLVELWEDRAPRLVPVTALRREALPEPVARLAAAPPPVLDLPGDRPLIMGVVNVTPDSFSDGGLHLETGAAIAHGRRLAGEGADIVDVGGESTRPGAAPVPLETELSRVLPVVEALAGDGIRVSIDTRKAKVMEAAAGAGAVMLNDVSALGFDPAAPATAARLGLPVVLMHSRGDPLTMQDDPVYDHAPLDVLDWLETRVEGAVAAGIARERLLIDPGIGFGKTGEHNLELVRCLGMLCCLGLPVVLGVSRKSFIARVAGEVAAPLRVPGSLAAGLSGVVQGARVLRVHDVAATRQALALWAACDRGRIGGQPQPVAPPGRVA
jgi:dihydropteroate synthase